MEADFFCKFKNVITIFELKIFCPGGVVLERSTLSWWQMQYPASIYWSSGPLKPQLSECIILKTNIMHEWMTSIKYGKTKHSFFHYRAFEGRLKTHLGLLYKDAAPLTWCHLTRLDW